jgi:hypothetical protein
MLLEFWYIQNRSYENGNSLNKVSFAMKDMEGNYILDDVLTSIELFDPDGTQIQPNEDGFGGSYQTVYGQYQPYDGWWSFGDTLRDESWYYINFDEPLKEGDYHLVVTDQSGNQYEAYATFNGVQSLPAISSETICAFQDSEGNIQWKWEIPPDKFSNVSTSIRTWLTGYSAGGNYLGEIYSRVPTHMGWSFAPANLIQQLEQAGAETFQIGIHVRTNDNNNRFYTSQVPWDEANGCGCDVDGNQKTGLVEAIHSLQVVAGIR